MGNEGYRPCNPGFLQAKQMWKLPGLLNFKRFSRFSSIFACGSLGVEVEHKIDDTVMVYVYPGGCLEVCVHP